MTHISLNRIKRNSEVILKTLLLFSLQEWSLEEWDKERARFTFLKSSLEMVVLFGSEISGKFSKKYCLCYEGKDEFI